MRKIHYMNSMILAAFLVMFSRSLPPLSSINLQLSKWINGDTKTKVQIVTTSPVVNKQVVLKGELTVQKSAFIDTVPFIKQLPELERGCEVTSLAMLIQSAGVSADKLTLAKEVAHVPFLQGNYQGNPNDGFVGDIYTHAKSGFGVYHGPLFQLAQKYLPQQALDLTGKDMKTIYSMLNQGVPVLVITNTSFAPLNDDQFETWDTNSGPVTITYNEHSVIIVGYDEKNVYINDPLAGTPKTAVPRQNFEQAWIQMGSQAISYEPI